MKTVEKILHTIKRDGSVTAKQIAEQFSITTMGARQHLQTLENDGLLEVFDVKVKVGRPTRHWALTDKGHEHFADRHGDLTIQVIDAIEHLFGNDGLKKVTQEREKQTLANYQQVISADLPLEKKVYSLAKLRESDGYMVEIEPIQHGYKLIENHCPICRAATRCPSLCESELNVFRQILGPDVHVEREEHIVAGERRCAYLIVLNEKTSQK